MAGTHLLCKTLFRIMQFSDFKLVKRFDWNPVLLILHLHKGEGVGGYHVVRCTLLAWLASDLVRK